MGVFDYDLIVVGSGPAGHTAAVQAARLRKSVAVVERNESVGGVCVNTGTIPSKTMREALIYLSGYREHLSYGASYSVKQKITMKDLLFRVGPVVNHEIDVMRHQLLRNGVELITAEASFVDSHTLCWAAAQPNDAATTRDFGNLSGKSTERGTAWRSEVNSTAGVEQRASRVAGVTTRRFG
jgi:NAD(P) transhydrogenase